MPVKEIDKNVETVMDVMVLTGLTKSKGEARRLIEGGGVSIGDKKLTANDFNLTEEVKQAGEVVLATTGETYADVAISWAADNDCVAVNGGALTFTLPVSACTVTLTATITCNEDTYTATFTVAVSAAPKADEATYEYPLQSATAGTQYADESKVLDENVTISTHNKGCHFHAKDLRIYDSSTNNGWAILTSKKVISAFSLTTTDKADGNIELYGSTDGTTWTLIETIASKSKNTTYTVSIDAAAKYTYLKLDANGGQVRVGKISLTLVASAPESDER